MRLIIAGPRDLYPSDETIAHAIQRACEDFYRDIDLLPTKIITGGASGVDACARHYALKHGYSTCEFEADWKKYGRAAGPIRNKKMSDEADALLVIKRKGWDTPGTSMMILTAEKRGMPVYIEEVEN